MHKNKSNNFVLTITFCFLTIIWIASSQAQLSESQREVSEDYWTNHKFEDVNSKNYPQQGTVNPQDTLGLMKQHEQREQTARAEEIKKSLGKPTSPWYIPFGHLDMNKYLILKILPGLITLGSIIYFCYFR